MRQPSVRAPGFAVAAVAIGAAIATGGCKKQERAGAFADLADAAADAAPPAEDAGAKIFLPPDLDTKLLEQNLGCARGHHGHACRILRELHDGSRFEGTLPPGGARWMGRAYRIDRGGSEKADFAVVHAIGVPTSTLGTADLPFKVGIDLLPKDKRRDAGRLVNALAHSERVPVSNKAFPFVKAYVSDNARLAMATAGLSVRLLAEDAVFVRQARVRQKLVVIRLKADASGAPLAGADGTYAELWPVAW
jgi:hypothetical protein